MNRREFLKHATVVSVATAVGAPLLRAQNAAQAGEPIAIFEKVFEALDYRELADAVAKTGADGIEATIRPRGHIEPAAAAEELPVG